MYRKICSIFFIIIPFINILANTADKEKKIKGNFDIGMNINKGTQNIFQLNNVFHLSYKNKQSLYSIKNNISIINTSNDDDVLNKGVQTFIYSLKGKKINGNINIEHFYDKSRFIKQRLTFSAGIFKDVLNKKNKLSFGASLLKEKSTYISLENELKNRLSTTADALFKINKYLEFKLLNQYQPNLDLLGDFRWRTDFSLKFIINSRIILKISNIYNYTSYPQKQIPEADYQMINSLSYTF